MRNKMIGTLPEWNGYYDINIKSKDKEIFQTISRNAKDSDIAWFIKMEVLPLIDMSKPKEINLFDDSTKTSINILYTPPEQGTLLNIEVEKDKIDMTTKTNDEVRYELKIENANKLVDLCVWDLEQEINGDKEIEFLFSSQRKDLLVIKNLNTVKTNDVRQKRIVLTAKNAVMKTITILY